MIRFTEFKNRELFRLHIAYYFSTCDHQQKIEVDISSILRLILQPTQVTHSVTSISCIFLDTDHWSANRNNPFHLISKLIIRSIIVIGAGCGSVKPIQAEIIPPVSFLSIRIILCRFSVPSGYNDRIHINIPQKRLNWRFVLMAVYLIVTQVVGRPFVIDDFEGWWATRCWIWFPVSGCRRIIAIRHDTEKWALKAKLWIVVPVRDVYFCSMCEKMLLLFTVLVVVY